MFKNLKKITFPLIAAGMVMGIVATAHGGIGDTVALANDGFGRKWFNPFDGLSALDIGPNTYDAQVAALNNHNILFGTNFVLASQTDVAEMYCMAYHGVDITPSSTICSTNAIKFAEYGTDFGFVDDGTRSVARTTSGSFSSKRVTGYDTDGSRLLDFTLILGTNTLSFPVFNIDTATEKYGFMYYELVPAPSVLGLMSIALIFVGVTSVKRREA